MSSLTTTSSTEFASQEQALALMDNPFSTLAHSNQPLQQEISRTAAAFQRFVEEIRQSIQEISRQNVVQREQLMTERSRNNERMAADHLQMQAS